MKHNAFTALTLAAALVVAGSAGAQEFSIDFESYNVGDKMTGETGWTQAAGDESAVVYTNSSNVLGLETGDEELIYTTSSTEVSILTMDVCFVGADEAPATNGFTGQTMVYLDVSDAQNPALKALVGSGWQTISTAVTDGSWSSLKMTFDYANDTVKFKVGTEEETTAYNLPATASQTDKVAQVGFKGTGFVDNFVGDKAGIPMKVGDDAISASATISGTTVSADYGSLSGIQFIRVYDDQGNFVTLRTSSAQAAINAVKLPGNISYVNAATNGTATAGVTPEASAVAVDTTGQTTQISITVPDLVSGVYYTPVAPDGTALADSVLVAPQNDGESTTFTVPAETTGWGVVKFKILASDEEFDEGDDTTPVNP